MEHLERTQLELKIALAILRINISTYYSHKRIISSSELILCWRKAPPGTFIEVIQGRVKGRLAHDTLEGLLTRINEIHLTPETWEAELILGGAAPHEGNILSVIRHSSFKKIVANSISLPSELIYEHDYLLNRWEKSEAAPGTYEPIYKPEILYSRAPVEQIYTTYAIHFGTDRLLESGRTVKFGCFRSDDKVSYGVAEVSIPHIHKEGKLERPMLWPYTLKGNPNKHIVVHNTALLDLEAWLSSARTYLRKLEISKNSNSREGLLFIHGYNVNFDAALWRSAQLCHDLKFPGLMLCFSWASLGSAGGYPADEATVDWSASNLKEYLSHVTQSLDLSALHIVAHSMGNRALLSVLENWENKPGTTPISQVILAAPDVDCSRFKQFGRVFNAYEQVTLYASRNDRAIAASQFVHSYPRAGGANPPLVMDHLSTIDVSSAGKDMFGLGHSYVAEVSKVFRDLFYIIRHRHKPDERAGIKKRNEGYWELT